MPPTFFPLRWESTGDQWWFASPIDWAAANGHYDLVRELLHLDTNLLIKLTSLRRIRRLESVWDDEDQFDDVAKCRSQVAKQLLLECQTKKGQNSLIRAGYGGWLLYTAASAGDVHFVKDLLERDPFLVFGEGEYGVTDILYAAARSKNCEVFRLLLDYSLPSRPVAAADSLEELEEPPVEVSSAFRWEMMNRAVHATARGGNLDMLKELLGDCSNILVYRDAQGSSLLHTASGRGQVEVVKHLLASYDITNSTDEQGNTALNVAAYRGYLPVVEVLICASPSTTSLKNNYGDTFLHMAVAGFRSPGFRRLDRQIELMKKLVCGKIVNLEDIINARNNDGRTALHMAVIENIQTDLVELLMSVPLINLNIRDADGNTPLDLLKQRPQSASSEILIKRLISAGGISNCQDRMTRSAIASHLKMQGIGGSPGTSFRIPDAEIFLYTGTENASDAGTDIASTEYDTFSGELSHCGSATGSYSHKKKSNSSANSATRRLKMLFHLPMRKDNNVIRGDTDSVDSFKINSSIDQESPVSLRQRFSKTTKRVLAPPNNDHHHHPTPPSPLSKSKFAAGLMHGVIQVKRQLSFGKPSSPLSESSWLSSSSPVSIDKEKGSLNEESPSRNKPKMQKKNGSFNIRLMNQYLCFGAQGIAADNPISFKRQNQSFGHSNHR
ncbi:hypothetical protein M9H77_10277 [Catharanthus roseus]|uniref:Uncharacterized protein n=1 Tax=Catharanthus roseus TaxID=4058 RepID=A0ACC0C2Z6_CATRO|nr:hypothetical protein M9H77_10277 [Catharanthus roseus]